MSKYLPGTTNHKHILRVFIRNERFFSCQVSFTLIAGAQNIDSPCLLAQVPSRRECFLDLWLVRDSSLATNLHAEILNTTRNSAIIMGKEAAEVIVQKRRTISCQFAGNTFVLTEKCIAYSCGGDVRDNRDKLCGEIIIGGFRDGKKKCSPIRFKKQKRLVN